MNEVDEQEKPVNELTSLSDLVIPGKVMTDEVASLAHLRTPLSDYGLNVAEINQRVLERGSVSALVVVVRDGKPVGVNRLFQFKPFNENELGESTLRTALLYGRIMPGECILVDAGSLVVASATTENGKYRNLLIRGSKYGIMPLKNGGWSNEFFTILPEHLGVVFGFTPQEAIDYLKRLFRVVENPFSLEELDSLTLEERLQAILRRANPQ